MRISRKMKGWFIFCSLFLCSCGGSLKKTEYQKIREANQVQTSILRAEHHTILRDTTAEANVETCYPWQGVKKSTYPQITSEFFRCKGDAHNPTFLDGSERVFDCNGAQRHSLPLKDQSEFIYPALLDILNYLQYELDAQVVVTCGHRCPQHNRYADPSDYNKTSKHMIGAEVDFYVKGYENKPLDVIEAIINFYQSNTLLSDRYRLFQRYQKQDVNVSTMPWFNHEIFVKLYKANEGRDADNQHAYPYISIQVRHDRETQQRVTYTWQQAFYNYLRN